MKTMFKSSGIKRFTAILLCLAMALSWVTPAAFAAEKGSENEFGALKACEGHVLGTFSDLPACVNEAGDLHICENNFPNEKFQSYLSGKLKWAEYITPQARDGLTDIAPTSYYAALDSLKGIEFLTELKTLDCKNNGLTSLDLSNNKKLESLDCSGRYQSLTSLDLSALENLKSLTLGYSSSGGYTKISELDISHNTKLETLTCTGVELKSLDVTGLVNLKSLDCSNNKLTTLDLSGSTALLTLNCSGNSLAELNFGTVSSLENLNCSSNPLGSIDVSNLLDLKKLECYYDRLTTLDVSNNLMLEYVSCFSNQLTVIDFSGNPRVTYINCASNAGAELNVSGSPALATLDCAYMGLDSLDLSENPQLTTLRCTDNNITSLDLSHNEKLISLECKDNPLDSIDLSKNLALQTVNFSKSLRDVNRMTTLDLSDHTALKTVNCADIPITSIDVSGCTALTELTCSATKLTSLDISTNVKLQKLYCYGSAIRELDVSNNPALTTLSCNSQTVYGDIYEAEGGKWTVDLGDFVSSENLDRITGVSEGSKYNNTEKNRASYDPETGIATFETEPSSGYFHYYYDLKKEFKSGGSTFNELQVSVIIKNTVRLCPHEFGDIVVSVKATCQKKGFAYRDCSLCGYREYQYPDIIPHEFGEWETVTEPGCTEAGLKKHTCVMCHIESETEKIEPTGHSYQEPVFRWSDDSKEALAVFTCIKADDVQEIKADVAETSRTQATCTEDGRIIYTATLEFSGKTYTDTNETTGDAAKGHSYTNYKYNNNATYFNDGTETAECDNNCGTYNTRTASGTKLSDDSAPSVTVAVGNNVWHEFLNKITFGLFFKDTQTVTISAYDNESGLDTVYYYLSNTEISQGMIKTVMDWTEYEAPFGIDPDNEYVVYVKAVDKVGNISYCSTDGIVLDSEAPIIKGVLDGEFYNEPQTVTIDEKYVDSVKLNDADVELDENNSFLLDGTDGEYTITALDKAGNTSTLTVTLDKTAPKIDASSELREGGTYCIALTGAFDEENLLSVTVNGTAMTLEGNSFTMGGSQNEPIYGALEIVALDKAGNSLTVNVTLNADHTYGEWLTLRETTCVQRGVMERRCEYCDAVETLTATDDEMNRSHSYGEPIFTWSDDNKAATATFICEHSDEHTVTLDAAVTSEIKAPATCTESGTTTYTAKVTFDGKEYTAAKDADDIPATGHSYGDWQHDENEHWRECECGDKTDRGEHTFGDWVEVKPATETEESVREHSCSVCGYSEQENIPVLDEKLLLGDVNENGIIDSGDATMVLRSIVGLMELTPRETTLADINRNGDVEAGDATVILRIAVGLEKHPDAKNTNMLF